MVLLQDVADQMIAEVKTPDDSATVDYPSPGTAIHVPLHNDDGSEKYFLDVQRGRIALHKINHNLRVRTSIPLVRLDINGPPHQNPDGSKVTGSHIHIYREGFGDSWAYELDPQVFTNLNDIYLTLEEFASFCNIKSMPPINTSLF